VNCAAGGCPNQSRTAGWCSLHYSRLRSFDQLDLPTSEQRFWRHVDTTDSCWVWTGPRNARKPAGTGSIEAEPPTMLVCSECENEQPAEAFSPNRRRKNGYQSYCRRCGRARRRRGLGIHADDAGLECPPDQQCQICGSDGGNKGLCLDHDHATGRFRGWLCLSCNTAVGHLADSPARAQALIAYLTREAVTQRR
jgi:hypothetical protein